MCNSMDPSLGSMPPTPFWVSGGRRRRRRRRIPPSSVSQQDQPQQQLQFPYPPPNFYPWEGYGCYGPPPCFPLYPVPWQAYETSSSPFHSSTPWSIQLSNPASLYPTFVNDGGGIAESKIFDLLPIEPVESESLFPQPDATKFPISDLGDCMGGAFNSDECIDSLMGESTDSWYNAWLNADFSSLFAGVSFLPSSSFDVNRVVSSTEPSCHLHPWHAPMPVPAPPALPFDKSACRSPPSPLLVSIAVNDKGKVAPSSPGPQSPESLPLLASLVDCTQIADSDPDRATKTLKRLRESRQCRGLHFNQDKFCQE